MWYLGVRAGFSQKEMGWLQAVSPAAVPHVPPPASDCPRNHGLLLVFFWESLQLAVCLSESFVFGVVFSTAVTLCGIPMRQSRESQVCIWASLGRTSAQCSVFLVRMQICF